MTDELARNCVIVTGVINGGIDMDFVCEVNMDVSLLYFVVNSVCGMASR